MGGVVHTDSSHMRKRSVHIGLNHVVKPTDSWAAKAKEFEEKRKKRLDYAGNDITEHIREGARSLRPLSGHTSKM